MLVMWQTQKGDRQAGQIPGNNGVDIGAYTAGETKLFESNDSQTAQSFCVQDNG